MALPFEILLHIATFLDPNDLACLALCSHVLHDALGRSSWIQLVNGPCRNRIQFLQQLSQDLPHMLPCRHCHRLHPTIETSLGRAKRALCLYPGDGQMWSISQDPNAPSYGILIYGQPENTDRHIRHCFSRMSAVAHLHYDAPHTSANSSEGYSLSINIHSTTSDYKPPFVTTQIWPAADNNDTLRFLHVQAAAVLQYSPKEIERDVLESIHICPHILIADLLFDPSYHSTHCSYCHIDITSESDDFEHEPCITVFTLSRDLELMGRLELFEQKARAFIIDFLRGLPWFDISASSRWENYSQPVTNAIILSAWENSKPRLNELCQVAMPFVQLRLSRTSCTML
ncbi:hypothetical protein BO94DRAFT_360083 [Aspergillus sclerotioniger CBS 115572]|uniref:F-box domain-containing protein n=1 Tax=Aspergillus sclerotioniger CBS 115572 TaxID=1450535 RepID=A0A317X3M0_9EURO|nr:hypothetical protein BO94DRAFT_360083 [Aspergillus sclerotioniger CBS 115572]PWY93156.1 hypothetical protein BO94DRAFT_360083 [Aspergillus sclerotioniger CBS 115572]